RRPFPRPPLRGVTEVFAAPRRGRTAAGETASSGESAAAPRSGEDISSRRRAADEGKDGGRRRSVHPRQVTDLLQQLLRQLARPLALGVLRAAQEVAAAAAGAQL